MSDTTPFLEFVNLIETLRAPGGCPWDAKQTHQSIASNIIEEAYEAVEAIERGDIADLKEELGDVLLQVVLQSEIARNAGEFTIDDVIEGVHSKMVRRHPHVFGKESVANAEETLNLWARIKREEQDAEKLEPQALFSKQTRSLPALMLAQDISKKAVAVGFEWESSDEVLEKFQEEVAEFNEAGLTQEERFEEFGDILFTLVNLGRKHRIDSESALRASCNKFLARWEIMEQEASARGEDLTKLNLIEQEALWARAKALLAAE